MATRPIKCQQFDRDCDIGNAQLFQHEFLRDKSFLPHSLPQEPICAPALLAKLLKEMVLPIGIEPTTPSLPRTCSTPELRQHARKARGARAEGGFVPQSGGLRKNLCFPFEKLARFPPVMNRGFYEYSSASCCFVHS